ncbi:MAG: DUF3892 domain-containing protein [Blastochloris viridis]|uniref:DUF3892 domain-containing protein n=1 Tax=Blastochloris viridis TaxID=1079 RepID=A0A6N4R1H1_BLAVI|nr:MAG: DUF3892 domain-containing protein [Blastochloris viridis]
MTSYQVTHIALSNGSRHEHITHLYAGGRWWPKQEVVQSINAGNQFYTEVNGRRAYLKVVDAIPPYVQTYADNTLTDTGSGYAVPGTARPCADHYHGSLAGEDEGDG